MKTYKLKNGKDLIVEEALPEYAEKMIEYLNIVGGESHNLLFEKNGFHLTVEQEREYLKSVIESPKSKMFVCWIDGKLCSVCQVGQISTRNRIAHRGEIAISVKKEYWGLGIANIMMGEMVDFARACGLEVLQLEVIADNERAIHIYKKFGFKTIGVFEKFSKINGEYFDAYYMQLVL